MRDLAIVAGVAFGVVLIGLVFFAGMKTNAGRPATGQPTAIAAQAQVRATVSAVTPTATSAPARPTVAPTAPAPIIPTARPTATSAPVVFTGLNLLLIPIDGQRLSTSPSISNEYSSFATYAPASQAPATKIETLVHLEATSDKNTGSSAIHNQRDSAYPAQSGLTLIRGVILLHGWTDDRQPPSYLLAWVEDGPNVITVSLDSSAEQADRLAVERQGMRVAQALVGHLAR